MREGNKEREIKREIERERERDRERERNKIPGRRWEWCPGSLPGWGSWGWWASCRPSGCNPENN